MGIYLATSDMIIGMSGIFFTAGPADAKTGNSDIFRFRQGILEEGFCVALSQLPQGS
jgi:hypothetical protein